MKLTARQAADRLEISLDTLYAYVSRGMLRSTPVPGTRARSYDADEVEAFRQRRGAHRSPERAAEAALDAGDPVLASSISLIQEGRLFYRGHDAVDLARRARFEEVVGLLWGAPLAAPTPPGPRARAALAVVDDLVAIDRMSAVLPAAAAEDPAAWDTRPAATVDAGGRILGLLAWVIGRGRPVSALADAIAPDPTGRALVDAALILAADHELNVSAFTARCVASAGATAYDAVAAGLCALRGARHGGLVDRVTELLDEAGDAPEAELQRRLRRGETIPGFGHPLYPEGDPRARALLDLAARHRPGAAIDAARRLADAGERVLREAPTIDLGLAAVGRALGLPADGPLALFALGRTAGWVAHVLEQQKAGRLIRPRARYTGPPPIRS